MGQVCSRALPQIYSTNKEVKLLDRKLGLLYGTIIVIVLLYVIGVRLVAEKGYMKEEHSYGTVGIQLNGTTYTLANGIVKPYDVASLVLQEEGDALFLPTRSVTTRDQRLGNCTSPDEQCSVDSDCLHAPPLAPGKCEAGHCERYQWCNPGSTGTYVTSAPANPFTGSAVTTGDEVLQELGRLSIVLIADINFADSGDVLLQTESERPNARVRWTIAQVLQRAGMTEKEAQASGGVLSVVMMWDCSNLLDSASCMPRLQVSKLASSFYHEWANYYRRQPDTSVLYRDLHQAYGLRLLVTTEGRGRQFSIQELMMQVFVALALMPIASGLADTIMQHLFSERRHYREYKTENSPDFSDVRAKVEQLEKQTQSRQAKAMNYA